MSIPKIDIFETRTGYVIRWIIDGDDGGDIGEGQQPDEIPTANEMGERDSWIAHQAAKPFAESGKAKYEGFTFESASKATAAVRAIRAAFRADLAAQQGAPWPQWAITAKAAGWTAPRGWKP